MFILKIVKAVVTDTGIVFTLIPVGDDLSGEIFMQTTLDTTYKVGDELVAEIPAPKGV